MPFLTILAIATVFQLLAIGLQRSRATYQNQPHVFAWLYACGGISLFAATPDIFKSTALPITLNQLGATILLIGGMLLLNHLRPLPASYLGRHPRSYFLNFNPPFVLAKVCDIFFQQAFLLSFTLTLAPYVPDLGLLILTTIALFALAHVPLFLLQRKVSVIHILGAVLFVGIVPPVLLHIPHGFGYMVLGHWLFYVVARLTLGQRALRSSLLGQDLHLETTP